ncbi:MULTISPECIES: hypothetical protein [Acinetobacter calcoaceticus/baumannii complex]|uniref:hypothetical protein n=1 Tax=Acinetobacter calcoaceticus/baumannii complex TaxID=909768 RepID=UPI00229F0983|nr:hypothetical protein [Acinetobacter nosocomialis]EHU2105152.1 hypothetical protein [Acinetobacter baumannii]MDC4300537.1 hypothetical protein [Acinetobacter baumannii]MDC4752858.1 hypothetical protein [Acinetobacter baumannii]MDC5126729.1 hypothetical protein [Acinetobacter baumannii]MDC5237673.1 hypothetical protein [Acinetobacter baumannii]
MTAKTAYLYKLPKPHTYAAAILTELLNGKKITNAQMMILIDCPHAGSIMSKIRQKFNWLPYLKQRSRTAISGMGDTTYEYEYWIDPVDIIILKANDPRIDKFLEMHRKNS